MVEFGLNLETIGGGAGIILVIALIIWISKLSKERKAEYGTRAERRLERETGLGKFSNFFKKSIRRSKQEEKKEKNIEIEVEIDAKKEKKEGASKDEKEANKAVEKDVEAVESEKEVEKDTEALEGRGVGMVASVKGVVGFISNYLASVRPSMQREEKDVESLENLMKSLNNTSNFSTIDGRVAKFLKQIFTSMSEVIKRSVEDEHEKETHHGELVKRVREIAKEARGVIKAARTALKMLQKAKKKERKNFKQELKAISNSIKNKRNELKKISRSKQADRTTIAQLQREINLMQQQHSFMDQLNKQLKNTYRTMDREASEIRRLLRAVSGTERQVGKHEKTADKREKSVEKRFNSLNKLAEELEKSFEGITENSNLIHKFAIEFSGRLKEFYGKYKEIVSGDLVFDEEIRNILLLNITIAMQMEAFERMTISLDQAEKAVDQGLGAATNIAAAIVGGQDQKNNLKNLIGEIKKAGGEIDYESRVEMFLQQLTKRIEEEERSVNGQISELVNEDKRIAEEIDRVNQENSGHIGQAMGTMVNRKIQIDTKYMNEARKFEQQLQSRNQVAGRNYKLARSLKARREPAP